MRVIASVGVMFAGLFWSGLAGAAPVAWVLEGDTGVPCVLKIIWDDRPVTTSGVLEPGCELFSIAFAGDEAILLFSNASRGRQSTIPMRASSSGVRGAAVWHVTPRATTKLAPPLDFVSGIGSVDGKIAVLGRIAGETYSRARAAIAVIVPNDPGCRPTVAKALTLTSGKWALRERVEGDCTSGVIPDLVEVPRAIQADTSAASARVNVHAIKGRALAGLPKEALALAPHEEWWLSDPPVLAWRTAGDETAIVMLDAPGKPMLRMAGVDPISSDRDGTRLVTTGHFDQTALVARIADGKALFVSSKVICAGFWGVPDEYDDDEGW